MQKVKKQHLHFTDFPADFFDSLIEKAKTLLNAKRVLLFGSFARGDALEKSDVDIAVEFKGGNWLTFKEWVEEKFPTLRQVDIVDLNSVDIEFAEKIEQEGIELYNKNKIAPVKQ